jgi:GNAT superfamily N-acetyltransferase
MNELESPQKSPHPDPSITRTVRRTGSPRAFEIRFNGQSGYFYLCLAERADRARVERCAYPGAAPLLKLRHLWINPASRGTGLGKATLARILSATDALGASVCLNARPFDDKPLDVQALCRMYLDAGFALLCRIRSGPWKGDPFMFRRAP